MKNKLIIILSILCISCENSDNEKKSDIEAIVFNVSDYLSETEPLYIIDDLKVLNTPLYFVYYDGSSKKLEFEDLELIDNIVWKINNEVVENKNQYFFVRDLVADAYYLESDILIDGNKFTAYASVNVNKHEETIANGFKTISLSNSSNRHFIDVNNHIWVYTNQSSNIGSFSPILKINELTIQKFYSSNHPYYSATSTSVYSDALVDLDGNFWFINKYLSEISKLDNATLKQIPFDIIPDESNIGKNLITDYFYDLNYLLLTDQNGHLNMFNKSTEIIEDFSHQANSGAINDFSYCEDGYLWVLAEENALILDGDKWINISDKAPEATDVLMSSGLVFIGDLVKGLIVYNDENVEWNNYGEGIISPQIVTVDRLESIYVVSSNEIYKFLGDSFEKIEMGTNYSNITAISFNVNNKMIISHDAGISIQQ